MGEKIVEALVDADKLKSVADFYRLSVEDIASLDRQGIKNATKIINEINEKRIVTIPELLAGLNIRNLSVKRAEILEDNFVNLEDILKVGTRELVAIEGFEDTLATFIVSGLRAKKKLIDELLTLVRLKPKAQGVLSGKSFCFSGFRDSKLEDAIKRKGGTIASGVNKKLNFLIVVNKNGTTSKIAKEPDSGANSAVN
jgi:DNA ligase (NAD+)